MIRQVPAFDVTYSIGRKTAYYVVIPVINVSVF